MPEKTNYLKEFQAANGLMADGIFGRKTANKMIEVLHIPGAIAFGHWFAQCEVESGHFLNGRENMNYSAQRMAEVWPGRFAEKGFNSKPVKPYKPNKQALALHHKPVELANFTYGDRTGLGNRGRGTNDGWDYRGGAATQLTGRGNYLAYFKYKGLPPGTPTDTILKPEYYFDSAVWFWTVNGIWQHANNASDAAILACSRAVNCGSATSIAMPIGWVERKAGARAVFATLGAA